MMMELLMDFELLFVLLRRIVVLFYDDLRLVEIFELRRDKYMIKCRRRLLVNVVFIRVVRWYMVGSIRVRRLVFLRLLRVGSFRWESGVWVFCVFVCLCIGCVIVIY